MGITSGYCFGEMGYLAKEKCTDQVVAKMQQISKDCQLFFSKMFIATLIKRLDETSGLLEQQGED